MKILTSTAGYTTLIDKYVKIRKFNEMPEPYAEQLKTATGVMNRYLKKQNMKVKFTPTGSGENQHLMMDMTGYNPLLRRRTDDFTTTSVKMSNDDPKPFLRRVYEELQDFAEGTLPRVEQMKRETREKLRKMGKIRN